MGVHVKISTTLTRLFLIFDSLQLTIILFDVNESEMLRASENKPRVFNILNSECKADTPL
jgi:hypothetical protein